MAAAVAAALVVVVAAASVKCLLCDLFLFYFHMLTIGLELWPMATVYTATLFQLPVALSLRLF